MRKIYLYLVCLLSAASIAYQANALTSLDQLMNTALMDNHDVAYASRSAVIDQSNVDIRNLFPPPHFTVEWRGIPVNSFGNATGTMYMISQQIPFPTKLAAQWSILNTQAQSSGYEYNINKVKLIKQVRSAYYQYVLNDKLAKLEYNNYRFLEILYKSELKNYELGYSTQIDLIDVKTRLISSSTAAQIYITNQYNAIAMLQTLNALPSHSMTIQHGSHPAADDVSVLSYDEKDIDNIPHISQSPQELKAMAIKHNPTYQKLRYEAQIAGYAADSAQATYLPDINIAFSQMESSVPNMSERRFSVGMDIPWLWGGGVQSNRSYQESLSRSAQYYMGADEIVSGMEAKSANVFVFYNKLNEYKPILPIIEKQMKQVNLNYATRYDEPKALESAYNQFLKVNNAGKNYYEMYLRYIELAIDIEELAGERLW